MEKKIFVVCGTEVVRTYKEEEIEAETRDEAVRRFQDMHPGHPVDAVEAGDDCWNVLGTCENTGKHIFEGDDYCHDEEGIMWLPDENGDCGCDEEDVNTETTHL